MHTSRIISCIRGSRLLQCPAIGSPYALHTSHSFHASERGNYVHIQETESAKAFSEPRPFLEIPDSNPNKLRGLIEVIKRRHEAHIVMKERQDQYGPILRNKMGPFNTVFISDPDAIENFFRQEDKYPERVVFEPWLAQWKELEQQYGLLLRWVF